MGSYLNVYHSYAIKDFHHLTKWFNRCIFSTLDLSQPKCHESYLCIFCYYWQKNGEFQNTSDESRTHPDELRASLTIIVQKSMCTFVKAGLIFLYACTCTCHLSFQNSKPTFYVNILKTLISILIYLLFRLQRE